MYACICTNSTPPVELVVVIVEQVVALDAEQLHHRLEPADQWLDALEVRAAQQLELLRGAEQVDELDDPPAEQVELAEDLRLGEVELPALGHGRQLLLDLGGC
jgi:hypothetical protein